ncbi:M3 family oligoendopeptidase [Sediminibacillus albus]|uniref:Oligoendopeptidase, pepF/M3 family n=1 Tax=Sediminibacillus albus TaxID=407036 RepID=A0A1G8WDQ3_9BACI|nr:M3 family oligoendopeptidase [Sediminibacillus albus]SDJ76353.1 oligoendopeptidase, pepF/M3 family [Sediminibacillus albus]
MSGRYNPRWILDDLFEGGSSSQDLADYIEALEQDLNKFSNQVKQFPIPERSDDIAYVENIISLLEKSSKQLGEVSAFVSCLTAEDVHDHKAKLLVGKRSELGAKFSTVLTILDRKFVQIPSDIWNGILEQPTIAPFSFVLHERRQKAMDKLPVDQEILVNDLAVDGYHAWGEMYDAIVAKMGIDWNENGTVKRLSIGQAANLLSSPERNVRKSAFDKLEKAWLEYADLFSETLNHLAGFRLQTYKHRKWASVLHEPVNYNRMSEKTLHAMWEAISSNKTPFVSYLKRKAELLGIERLSWFDLDAPVGENGGAISYDDAARIIIEQFSRFSTGMAEFAQMAFDKRWIEADNRPGKRPGGFCTSFPDSQQTRIFMTYSGTASNVATLAHELGHGYHQYVMNDIEILNQDYAMNVAETASTFAEMIVADAAVKNAETKEQKISLLDDKIQRSVAFFMNIHSRYLFETRFYEERKSGLVSTEKLNHLMKEAQRDAYCGALYGYDPTFWASKLHFHITDVPFYNFPYTFGYLFSLGIYADAINSGDSFEEAYVSLLRDTGRMNVEDLAKKHLNVNLDRMDFWEKAIQLCIDDVEEFLKLTESQ